MKSLQTTAVGRGISILAISENPLLVRLLLVSLFQQLIEPSFGRSALRFIPVPFLKEVATIMYFLAISILAFLPCPRRRRSPGALAFIDTVFHISAIKS